MQLAYGALAMRQSLRRLPRSPTLPRTWRARDQAEVEQAGGPEFTTKWTSTRLAGGGVSPPRRTRSSAGGQTLVPFGCLAIQGRSRSPHYYGHPGQRAKGHTHEDHVIPYICRRFDAQSQNPPVTASTISKFVQWSTPAHDGHLPPMRSRWAPWRRLPRADGSLRSFTRYGVALEPVAA